MSFIAAVLILNLDTADAFIAFSNLLNKPCQMAFFRVDHGLVSIPRMCVLLHSQVADCSVFFRGKRSLFSKHTFQSHLYVFLNNSFRSISEQTLFQGGKRRRASCYLSMHALCPSRSSGGLSTFGPIVESMVSPTSVAAHCHPGALPRAVRPTQDRGCG